MKKLFLRIVRATSVLLTGNDVIPGASLTVQMPAGIECHVHGIEDPVEIFSLPDGSRLNYPITFPEELRESGMGICINISLSEPEELLEDEDHWQEEFDIEN